MDRNVTQEISQPEMRLFGEMLWNSLAETRADQWSDFPWVIQVFCKFGQTYQLEGALSELDGDAHQSIESEIIRRRVRQAERDARFAQNR